MHVYFSWAVHAWGAFSSFARQYLLVSKPFDILLIYCYNNYLSLTRALPHAHINTHTLITLSIFSLVAADCNIREIKVPLRCGKNGSSERSLVCRVSSRTWVSVCVCICLFSFRAVERNGSLTVVSERAATAYRYFGIFQRTKNIAKKERNCIKRFTKYQFKCMYICRYAWPCRKSGKLTIKIKVSFL